MPGFFHDCITVLLARYASGASVICDVLATLSQEPMPYGFGREICPVPAINPAHPNVSFDGRRKKKTQTTGNVP